MERRFPKSPLPREENQCGCSWGFRSVFEFLFHGHSNRKLISSTTWFNRDGSRKFQDDKAVGHRDMSVSKSTVSFSPPSDRTCWPSMLKESNTVDKVPRSTLTGAFCHYLHLKHVGKRKSHGCRSIDTVDTNGAIVNQKLGTRHQSKQFLEALEILMSNKELFLKLLEDPCPARKIERTVRFRKYKRIVLSWRRMRSRKKLLLKGSRIVILEPGTEIENRRSYFPFRRWISKLKRAAKEHEKTTSDTVRNSNLNRRSNLLRPNEKGLTFPPNPDRKTVSCTTSTTVFGCELQYLFLVSQINEKHENQMVFLDQVPGFVDSLCLNCCMNLNSVYCLTISGSKKADEHNDDSEKSSLVSQESSPSKTRNTEDSTNIPPNLPTHELGPIQDYVKSLLVAAGLKWYELLSKCQVSDQLLLPTLYQEVKFASGDDSLLLFDYVNEVLLEVYHHHNTTKLGFFLAEENVSCEAMQSVDWDLVLHNRGRTLDQLVRKDLMRPGSWNDDRIGSEDIVAEVVESILEDLIEDI